MLYSALFAAGTSLLAVTVTTRKTANTELVEDLANTLGTCSELLLASLHLYQLEHNADPKTQQGICEGMSKLRSLVTSQSLNLKRSYDEASLEIVYSYYQISDFGDTIESTLRLRTLLTSRTGLSSDTTSVLRQKHVSAPLRRLIDELGEILLISLDNLRAGLAKGSHLSPVKSYVESQTGQVGIQVDKLESILEDRTTALRDGLAQAMGEALEGAADSRRLHLFEAHVSMSALPRQAG